MIRFISFLLGKPYESCKGCEILKQQLEISNAEKKELTATLINILKPTIQEAVPVEVQPLAATRIPWARRKAELEERDRQTARVLRDSKNLGRPDDSEKINKLEEELNINDTKETANG